MPFFIKLTILQTLSDMKLPFKIVKFLLNTVAIRTFLVFVLIQMSFTGVVFALLPTNVSVTATGGTFLSKTYNSLAAAITAINTGGIHTGVINIKINASLAEGAGTITINANSSPASYTSITIYPTVDALTITGSNVNALLDLSGATNVTIDGRVNKTGTTKSLTIQNTNSLAKATIRFTNDASSNTVKYCTIQGTSSSSSGILFFSIGLTNGNNSNIIDNNNITNLSTSPRP